MKRYCVKLLEKYGSFEYTRDVLLNIDKEVRETAKKLGDNPRMTELMDELLTFDKVANGH